MEDCYCPDCDVYLPFDELTEDENGNDICCPHCGEPIPSLSGAEGKE